MFSYMPLTISKFIIAENLVITLLNCIHIYFHLNKNLNLQKENTRIKGLNKEIKQFNIYIISPSHIITNKHINN